MRLLAIVKHYLAKFTLIVEFCHLCGRRQPLVWWCESDELYLRLIKPVARWPFRRLESGIVCPQCFDKLAVKAGIVLMFTATIAKNQALND